MKKKPDKDTVVRMNLEMSPKVRAKLEKLSDEMNLTLSEVLRKSLAVLDLLMHEVKGGGKILIRSKDEEREVLIV